MYINISKNLYFISKNITFIKEMLFFVEKIYTMFDMNYKT